MDEECGYLEDGGLEGQGEMPHARPKRRVARTRIDTRLTNAVSL